MTEDFEQFELTGLSNSLSALGFRTVTDLLNDRPGTGYLKVSDELKKAIGYRDVSLSAATLHYQQLKEALVENNFRIALADSFYRCFLDEGHLRRAGWGHTPSPADQISMLSDWVATAKLAARNGGYDIESEMESARSMIWNLPLPDGWKPTCGGDPIIRNAVEKAFRDSLLK